MDDAKVTFEKDPSTHIAVLTIDNPAKKNAFDLELRNVMTAAMEDVAEDDDMKVMLLRGAGGVFCAGADMGKAYSWYDREGESRRPSQRRRLSVDRSRQHMYHLWCGFPKATVVQLEGLALGGGLELALGADIVVAGREARIGMPAARFLGPILGNLHLFFHRMGPLLTKRLLLTGDMVRAREVEHLGLFTEVVDDGEVAARAEYWARRVAKMPADGITLAKEAYRLVEMQNGMAGEEVCSYLFHSIGTNMRFEEDEFNFVKVRSEVGVSEAFKRRDEHFRVDG